MLGNIIHSNQQTLEQIPATEHEQKQHNKAEQGRHTARLTPPKDRAVFGVAASFFCHGFCKPTHLQHIYFFKRQKKKIKELHSPTLHKPQKSQHPVSFLTGQAQAEAK